jgi:flavin-dependent dehydrogenase
VTEHYDVIIPGSGVGGGTLAHTLASSGNIQMCGKSNAEAMKGEEPKLAPHWSLADVARHAVDFWLTTELRKILNHVGMAEHHVLDKNFYLSMNIPVAGAVNPALTAMANAIRVGEHLLDRMT